MTGIALYVTIGAAWVAVVVSFLALMTASRAADYSSRTRIECRREIYRDGAPHPEKAQ